MGFYKGFIPPRNKRAFGNSSSGTEVEMTPEISAVHRASLTQLGLNGGRFAHDVWTPFLHHICPFVQPLLFSPNQLKKSRKKHLASLHGDEVKQSHLRASDRSWELKVSREICPQDSWGGRAPPPQPRKRERKRDKQIC